jgi:hypothetical protein
LVGTDLPGGAKLDHQPFTDYSVPRDWRAYDWEKYEEDESQAQLVICLTDVQKRSEKKIGECPWVYLYPATYTYEVYTAKAARTVAVIKIDSDASVKSSCPRMVYVRPGQMGPDHAQDVKDETLEKKLRPIVMGRAR